MVNSLEELVAPIIALSCFPSLLAGQLPIQMRAGGATWMDGRSFGGEFKHFYLEIDNMDGYKYNSYVCPVGAF